jgi:hypothetical protein
MAGDTMGDRGIWLACAVLAIALAPAAVRAQAAFGAGFVPPGMYRVALSFNGGPLPPFELCFPPGGPEELLSYPGCISEWDRTQAGLTHFTSACYNMEHTVDLRQVDARTWEGTEVIVTNPPSEAQLAATAQAARPFIERQARNGNAKEQAEARRLLAEMEGMPLRELAASDAYRPQKFAMRVTRIAGRCDPGKQK